MLQAIINFIGAYNPVMTDVYDSAGQYVGQAVAAGAAGVDWSWIGACALSILVIFCLFRLIGGLLK